MAPEAIAFSLIGLGNLALYTLIFNVLLSIGPVKSSVIATLLTTYLAYLANRHWTYRHRARSGLRREYTLFFAFNMVGLLIQAGFVGIAKYGFGLNEFGHDRLAFNLASALGICVATLFRFWSYRTFVFKHEPVAEVDLPAEALPIAAPTQPAAVPTELTDEELAQLTASLDAEQPPTPARTH
jgi:putative flippase GtrA